MDKEDKERTDTAETVERLSTGEGLLDFLAELNSESIEMAETKLVVADHILEALKCLFSTEASVRYGDYLYAEVGTYRNGIRKEYSRVAHLHEDLFPGGVFTSHIGDHTEDGK